jgi:hypothetical protein
MNEPRKYDIAKPEELKRLHEELLGYLKVSLNANCPHCRKAYREGTDFTGRQFAIDALKDLLSEKGGNN